MKAFCKKTVVSDDGAREKRMYKSLVFDIVMKGKKTWQS